MKRALCMIFSEMKQVKGVKAPTGEHLSSKNEFEVPKLGKNYFRRVFCTKYFYSIHWIRNFHDSSRKQNKQ